MKLKKVILILICIMMTLSVFFAHTKSYAADTSVPSTLYVRRTTNRQGHLGYAIGNPNNGSSGGAQTIWNLLSMKNASSNEYFSGNEDGYHTLYCLDITKWMGNKQPNEPTTDTVTYKGYYDMDEQYVEVAKKFSESPFIDESNYHSLLWLMDNIYIPNAEYYKDNEEEKNADKLALLAAAGIEYDEEIKAYVYDFAATPGSNPDPVEAHEKTADGQDNVNYILTDDDIEAVQQAVMWRYTVNEESAQQTIDTLRHDIAKYNLGLTYTTDDGKNYNQFSNIQGYRLDKGGFDPYRDEQAIVLYNYLTAKADEAGKNRYTSIKTEPITINTSGLTEISTDNYKTNMKLTSNGYVLGPVSITKNNDLLYNIDLKVEDGNGNAITGYYFSDSTGTTLGKNKTIKDLVGQGDFYITVPDKTVEKVNVSIATDFRKTDKYVWYDTNSSNEYQPIAEPIIKKENTEIIITGEVEKSGQYDLILIKEDENGEQLNSTATFIVNDVEKKVTGKLTIADDVAITSDNLTKADTYVIKETVAPDGYCEFDGIITVTVTKKQDGNKYVVDEVIYKVTDENGKDITSISEEDINVYLKDGNIYVEVKNYEIDGKYDLVLVKEDRDGEQLNSKATFEVTGPSITGTATKEVTGRLEIAKDIEITANNLTTADVYTIKETVAPDEYCKFDGTITVTVTKKQENNQYLVDKVTYKVTDTNGKDITSETSDTVAVHLNENGNIYVEVKNYQFDLKLIKFITAVNEEAVDNRVVSIDMSKLNTKDANGNLITTGDYKLIKDPVSVQKGDYVTYTFRVYNEGDIAGYVEELSEDIPVGLEYVWAEGIEIKEDGTVDFSKTTGLTEEDKEAIEYNLENGWAATKNGYDVESKRITEISTEYLSKATSEDNLIDAFDANTDKVPDYKEVSVILKVVSTDATSRIIRNEAAITDDCDSEGNDVTDRDSVPEEWEQKNSDKYYDEDKKWPIYEEDDEDYDNIILQQFDLALRKFITVVGDEEISTRIPEPKYEDGQITYEHDKTPVTTVVGKIVTYTIRVYNEGNINGYAEKVSDDIPEYLEYLPENDINKEYRWLMYDEEGKETEDVSKAVKITTDYLSKENGETIMKEDSSLTENPNLLKAFDGTKLYHKDVKVAFKVKDPGSSETIITNKAQISEDADENGDEIEDIDSIPDEWNEGEDDQDVEHVKVQYFDLALRKYVTKVITIENGVEEVRQTGHTPEMDPEPVVKVELHRKKLSAITVKFGYTIRVTNEGEIAGYVKEITDYIPEGLKFVAEDNKDWKDEGNNVISTKLLENTLLQPGESASVEVILTWINGADNIGLKTNTAEISEDYNDEDIADRDSTPDNKVPGEDDIDDAPVILSIETGQVRVYYVLGFAILITLASGIIIIKKFIL